jgi:hypothetical protein
LFGAIFGVDYIRPGAMTATFLFWLGLLMAIDRVAQRRLRADQ